MARAKACHGKACRNLEGLYAECNAMRKDELWSAVAESERAYEEIVALIAGPRFEG